MGATSGSIYQAARLGHLSGSPPGTEPQRASAPGYAGESFDQYVARMATAALPPHINPTEADADYLIRLESYLPAVPFDASASFATFAQTCQRAVSEGQLRSS